MKEIDKLNYRPFTRFCMSIGAVPTSYLAGLTIEEQLLWFCSYLEKEVIPAVNNNAEAVEELQNLYIELHDYVEHYFDNLDVQEEINNKLDDMAESGDLENIIAAYLQTVAIFGFDTLTDLKNATNLDDGSYARTFGKTSIKDNKGEFYKIRPITSGDVVDDDNIVAVNFSNTLIAEKVSNDSNNKIFGFDTLNDLKNSTILKNGSFARTYGKSTINDGKGEFYKIRPLASGESIDNDNIVEVNFSNTLIAEKVNNELTDLVVFGDSWSDTSVTDAIWSPLAATNLGLTLKNYAINGARMTLSLAGEINNYLTHNNPKRAKYIVILGGLNDYDIEEATYTDLANAIKTGITTLQTNCPQAKIIYVSNCSYPFTYAQSQYWKNVHLLVRSTGIATYNMDGTWGKNIWNNSNYRHLTQEGQKYMCSNIIACLTGGEIQKYRETRQYETEKVTFDYAVERDGNMINMFAMITPKDNTQTNLSFTLPSGEPNMSYAGLFNTQGIIGSSYRVGVCDINAQGVTIVFQSAPNATKYYVKANFPVL